MQFSCLNIAAILNQGERFIREVIRSTLKKVVFLGCPLDCDEKHDAIQEKIDHSGSGPVVDDPLKPIVGMLAESVGSVQWRVDGSLSVPGWLRPIVPQEDKAHVTIENYVNFIDRNGCLDFARAIQQKVTDSVLPDFPCLITVDHSLSGGVYKALAEHYGRKNITLLVIDSHTDAIPMSRMAAAILYDAQTNRDSVFDAHDPYLHDRTESYNAGSFIQKLLEEGIVDPRDLFILGISDFPGKKAFRNSDSRIAAYVDVFSALKSRGATLITRQECQMQPTKVKSLLKRIRTPYAYLSIDMDIGARNAVEGVRFKNWRGLGEAQIFRLAAIVAACGGSALELVGMDIAEINPRTAGQPLDGAGEDPTYRVATQLIHRMVFNQADLSDG